MQRVLPAVILGAFFAIVGAKAQESGPEPATAIPTAAEIQAKVREWVGVQTLISEEETRWREEQQLLSDLNALRLREIKKLDEALALSQERVEDFDQQLKTLEGETAGLQTGRSILEKRIGALEGRARALLKVSPPPLRIKLGEAGDRLENPDPESPLQNRYRDVLTILIETGNFDRNLTLDTELRQIEGEEVELQVLYLGLGRAYYIDRIGRHAGVGVPGEDAWVWTENPELASEIRQTIAIHQKEAAPALVRLPVRIQN